MEINVITQEDSVVKRVLVREGNTVKNQEVLMIITYD